MKKAVIVPVKKGKSKGSGPGPQRAIRTVCTTEFTAVKKLTVALSGGIYTSFATLTIADFADFDAFIAVFRYYTLKSCNAMFTMPTAAQNGTVALIRPLTQLQDSGFVLSQIGFLKLVEDKNALILIQTSRNPTKVIRYADPTLRQECSTSSDKVGAYYVVDPNASSSQSVELIVRVIVTFYDRSAE